MDSRTVILTHEHADFDALASLLGGWLLFPQAQPVLPRTINRNGRAFLALYRNQLPFVEAKHLPKEPVDRAIVMDTRGFNAVRGMDEETPVLLIDHHTVDEPLPDGWQRWTEALGPHAVGANTTLLVEKLMSQRRKLTTIQASLLALGIYEDTGSLTYKSTTHRDARCVAWLLKQGANLEVVSQFIHFPMTEHQQELVQELVERCEHIEIAGQTILVATVDAPNFRDEVSALAHRLRDLYEVDGLFVAVGLGDRVQVVARSSTDAVNVGKVAKALGGGGHTRAAAALVREQDVEQVRQRIIALARQYTKPPTTVAEIMSRGRPQTVSPHLSVREAMQQMNRWGHEGFPVVEVQDGRERLRGILTRREADRTMAHKMGDRPVHKVMKSGDITIPASAAVDELHKLMIESGWGQIPVVDEAGQIVGIVTRTDLLKLLAENGQSAPAIPNAPQLLAEQLPPDQAHLLRVAGEAASRMGFSLYMVGGFVRDLLLTGLGRRLPLRPNGVEMDLVVEGDAIRLAEALQQEYGGRVVTHRRFGTAKWILGTGDWGAGSGDQGAGSGDRESETNHPITQSPNTQYPIPNTPIPNTQPSPPLTSLDMVTARMEFYAEPTALPTVEQGSIKLDLHRRDFSINTLAIVLTPERWGELLDFYGGVTDLHSGVVRALHSLSFVDDPTRILRAVRYEQRFDFTIEPRTCELLVDALPLIERVSPARIRHELERILQEAEPEKSLARLEELGALAAIYPGLRFGEEIRERFGELRSRMEGEDLLAQASQGEDPLARRYWGLWVYPLLPALEPPSVKESFMDEEQKRSPDWELIERLQLRGETKQMMMRLRLLKANRDLLCQPEQPISATVRLLDRVSPSILFLFSIVEKDPCLQERLVRYVEEWRHVQPQVDGAHLRGLGLTPGPIYGEILGRLRDGLLDGQIPAGTAEFDWVRANYADIPKVEP